MLFSAWQIEVKWVDTYHTVLDGVKVVWLVFCTQVSLCMISLVGCWASMCNDGMKNGIKQVEQLSVYCLEK